MLSRDGSLIFQLKEIVLFGVEASSKSAGNSSVRKDLILRQYPQLNDEPQKEEILNFVNARSEELIETGQTDIEYQGETLHLNSDGTFHMDRTNSESRHKDTSYVKKTTKTVFAKLGGIAISILALILINAFLLGGQEIYHYKDNQKLSDLEPWLKTQKSNIDQLNLDIIGEDSKLNTMESLMYSWKQENTEDSINKYNASIATYNSQVNKYNSDLAHCKTMIEEYNQKVEEYNKLAKDTGTRWYVIPVPGGKAAHGN